MKYTTKLYTFASLAIIGLSDTISAQKSSTLRKMKDADSKFQRYAYIDARKVYLDVVERGYVSQDLYEKLADSYYFNSELDKAVKWYEALYNTYSESIAPEYLFRYSQSLKNIGDYDRADKIMSELSKIKGEDVRVKSFVNTKDYMKFIDKQSGKFRLSKLSMNSIQSDHAPSFDHQGNVIFASARKPEGITDAVHEWNEKPFLDIYTSQRVAGSSILKSPKALKGKVNTVLHESSSTLSADGNTMYFTRNNYTRKKTKTNTAGTILLKVYKSTKHNNRWSQPVELPFNSDEYSVAHPALSSDGKRLYFASDMPGGFGQSDLYYVDINGEDNYGVPVNLGKLINTEGRETFPFISDEDELFFASDGYPGLGGLDIYVSLMNQKGEDYSAPYNVGKPINSTYDDFGFIIKGPDKKDGYRPGYFSSNRRGGKGDDDIYGFSQISPLVTQCEQFVSGIVTDAKSGKVLPKTQIVLMDGKNNKIGTAVTDSKGSYKFDISCGEEFVVRAKKDEYEPSEKLFKSSTVFQYVNDVPLALAMTEKEILPAEPVVVEKPSEPVVINNQEVKTGLDLGKVLNLDMIYFDLDKSYIRPDAEVELQKIITAMNMYPQLKIDVRSHTDSRASDRYNMSLSDRRAKSTVRYIIKQGGIDASRVTGRGYGESQLVNECSNGVRCSESRHQQNRRSEFIIVSQQ